MSDSTRSSNPRRRPLVLLTGFLGSGKTTLLQRLLSDPRMVRTAVIINELGEVGLDHLLVGRPTDDTVLLANGCVCCAVQEDFVATLKDLHRRQDLGEIPAFDRVVVETTGMADPSAALRGVLTDQTLSRDFRLHSVVTTVDASIPLMPTSTRPERLRQIAAADRLILTKLDLAGRDRLPDWRDALRSINATADIVEVDGDEDIHAAVLEAQTVSRLSASGVDAVDGASMPGTYAGLLGGRRYAPPHARVDSFVLHADTPLQWPRLVRFLRTVAQRHSAGLLRVKGVLDIAGRDHPVVLHGVHHYLYPETQLAAWPPGQRRSQLVFIVENVDRHELRGLFQELVLKGAIA